ncbi:hypothetical protein ABT124_47070 [Streptomyces sp. NPDC001982]|uniref:hypothetical protein n=1 Tax=Streptomyces sp. NPDC001982 TaxID=3154405 RepID=UPI0033266C13
MADQGAGGPATSAEVRRWWVGVTARQRRLRLGPVLVAGVVACVLIQGAWVGSRRGFHGDPSQPIEGWFGDSASWQRLEDLVIVVVAALAAFSAIGIGVRRRSPSTRRGFAVLVMAIESVAFAGIYREPVDWAQPTLTAQTATRILSDELAEASAAAGAVPVHPGDLSVAHLLHQVAVSAWSGGTDEVCHDAYGHEKPYRRTTAFGSATRTEARYRNGLIPEPIDGQLDAVAAAARAGGWTVDDQPDKPRTVDDATVAPFGGVPTHSSRGLVLHRAGPPYEPGVDERPESFQISIWVEATGDVAEAGGAGIAYPGHVVLTAGASSPCLID